MSAISEKIEELIKAATANAVAETRDDRAIQVGEVAQQGDVYVVRVADDHARGLEIMDRQVAEGDTQGSRHIVGNGPKLFRGTNIPSGVKQRALLGPVVVATTDWNLEHPEHPWHTLPAGTYQVLHQMDAITGRAVRD
jgi:hypothetical protein